MKNSISYIVIGLCLTLSQNAMANGQVPSLQKIADEHDLSSHRGCIRAGIKGICIHL